MCTCIILRGDRKLEVSQTDFRSRHHQSSQLPSRSTQVQMRVPASHTCISPNVASAWVSIVAAMTSRSMLFSDLRRSAPKHGKKHRRHCAQLSSVVSAVYLLTEHFPSSQPTSLTPDLENLFGIPVVLSSFVPIVCQRAYLPAHAGCGLLISTSSVHYWSFTIGASSARINPSLLSATFTILSSATHFYCLTAH